MGDVSPSAQGTELRAGGAEAGWISNAAIGRGPGIGIMQGDLIRLVAEGRDIDGMILQDLPVHSTGPIRAVVRAVIELRNCRTAGARGGARRHVVEGRAVALIQ